MISRAVFLRVAKPQVLVSATTGCRGAALVRPLPALPLRQFTTATPLYRSVPKGWKKSQPVTYEELKPITEQPSDDVLVVDVREPEEVIQGNIPSSVNLPLSSLEKTLQLSNDDFLRQNGFPKPSSDQPIIFYCRSGKRSGTAQEVAQSKGFTNTRNYEGSWLDWENREKSA